MKEVLLQKAKEALKNAYAPYSNFHVGAALLCKNGNIYIGCNVENIAGTSICAERTAVCKAISEGDNEFAAMAIDCENHFSTALYPKETLTPCGFCLQTLSEFCNADFLIHTPTQTYKLGELMPYRFSK